MADVPAIYHWTDGDLITAARLNTIEGIVSAVNADFLQKNKSGQTVSVAVTWSAAQTISAGGLTISGGMLTVSNQPRVQARGGSLTGNGSEVAIPFASTVHDVGDMWVSGSPTRITVPASAGGLYHCVAVLEITNTSGSTQTPTIRWRRNAGAGDTYSWVPTVRNGDTVTLTAVVDDTAAAADYFDWSLQAPAGVSVIAGASVHRVA